MDNGIVVSQSNIDGDKKKIIDLDIYVTSFQLKVQVLCSLLVQILVQSNRNVCNMYLHEPRPRY
jgi:hypothetical protein